MIEVSSYQHPSMGRFKLDEFGGYVQIAKYRTAKIRLVLDCGFQGPEHRDEHLRRCERTGSRVYDQLDKLVNEARPVASQQLLDTTNMMRDFEGKRPISSSSLERQLKLLDVCVSPSDFFVCFSCNAYDDEHGLFKVRYGPRGGLKEVCLE